MTFGKGREIHKWQEVYLNSSYNLSPRFNLYKYDMCTGTVGQGVVDERDVSNPEAYVK
jgi:hypothetical protein